MKSKWGVVTKTKWKVGGISTVVTALAISMMVIPVGSNAAGASSTKLTGKPIYVLAIADLTGADANFSREQLSGLEAGAVYWNTHGGILGRPVKIVYTNDNSDPATASAQAVSELSEHPGKFTAMMGGGEGNTILAVMPIAKRYDILDSHVNDGGAGACENVPLNCPTFFAQANGASAYASGTAAFAVKKGYKTVGILTEGISFTEGEEAAEASYLQAHGVTVDNVTFPPTEVSVNSEMQELQSDGAQEVIMNGVGGVAYSTFAARLALSWNVPLVFDIASSSSANIAAEAPKSELGNAYETAWGCESANSTTFPAYKYIYQDQKTAGWPVKTGDSCSQDGIGWDVLVQLHAAAEKAGSLKTAALVKALTSLTLTAKSNLLLMTSKECWSTTSHENLCNTTSDYPVVPIGNINDLKIQPLS